MCRIYVRKNACQGKNQNACRANTYQTIDNVSKYAMRSKIPELHQKQRESHLESIARVPKFTLWWESLEAN